MATGSQMPPAQLLALLQSVIRDAPAFDYEAPLTEVELQWLGRAQALLDAAGSSADVVDFRLARKALRTLTHSRDGLLGPLHNAYFRVELQAPQAIQGAFIPGGASWKGYAAVVELIGRECDDLLLVDPYLSSTLFTEFAPHSAAKNSVRCLTTKRKENHLGLVAAAQRWASDDATQSKQVEVRYAPNAALHDRLIILNGAEVWLVSQSLKDIAKKSPASVLRAEVELAQLKAGHYNNLWNESVPIL